MGTPHARISASVLGTPDPAALAQFYAQFLGWTVVESEQDWVMIKPQSPGTGLSFQREQKYVVPVWPAQEGDQQMMIHLDIAVPDLAVGVERAVELGASLAACQPQEEVRVMLDPDGHPFCLFEGAVELPLDS